MRRLCTSDFATSPDDYSAVALAALEAAAAKLAGASQLKAFKVEPWKVHSAAAGVETFFGFTGLGDGATVPDALTAADAWAGAEAPDPDEAAEATEATESAELAEAAEAVEGVAAKGNAEAPLAAEAAITWSIVPSNTTRDPLIPTPVWVIFNVSRDVSASLLRINCSHASEFL